MKVLNLEQYLCDHGIYQYARTSKRRREQRGEVSIERQIDHGVDYAQDNGLSKPFVIKDQHVSGGNANRAGFKALQELIKNGQVKVLIVYSLDRICRELELQLAFAKLLREYKVKFISLTEAVDLSDNTPEGKMQANIHGSSAQYFKDKISQKLALAWKWRKKNRQRYGGMTEPYGWKTLVKDGQKKLVPDSTEQDGIKLMQDLRSKGLGYEAIASELERRQVPTKTKKSNRWYGANVKLILGRLTEDTKKVA